METKKCSKCGKVKPVSEFNKNGVRNGIQRHHEHCKICRSGAVEYPNRVFKNNDMAIHVISKDDNDYFLAKDIYNSLGMNRVDSRKDRVDMEASVTLNVSLKGLPIRKYKFLTEAGMYQLIATSKKPEAKIFKDWIFAEVLPTIRKTGEYKTDVSVDNRLGDIGIKLKQPEIKERTCSKCNKTKSVNEFHSLGYNKSGIERFRSECKECYNESRRERAKRKARSQKAETVHERLEETVNDADSTPIEPTINKTLEATERSTRIKESHQEPIKEPEKRVYTSKAPKFDASKLDLDKILGVQYSEEYLMTATIFNSYARLIGIQHDQYTITTSESIKKAYRTRMKALHPDTRPKIDNEIINSILSEKWDDIQEYKKKFESLGEEAEVLKLLNKYKKTVDTFE